MVEAGVTLSGKSLLHSVPLTARAFSSSFLGSYGEYLVTIGLVLFAFSTALAWSYYGDRAVVYLVGTPWVMPYRLLYIGGFFVATIADTSLIWLISAITVALMTLPNLIGILMMRKELSDDPNLLAKDQSRLIRICPLHIPSKRHNFVLGRSNNRGAQELPPPVLQLG